MTTYHYRIFADYFQFYLQDAEADGDLSYAWTEQAVTDLLAVAPGTIGVGTARNMDVPIEVQLLDSEPIDSFQDWDQVNECDIEVPSGKIVVAGCTDYFPEAARIDVQPGSYRARIYYGNLNSVSGDGDGADHYKVVLWLSESRGVRVIKRRSVR